MNTADVVIGGAGIVGLSVALELAALGLRVTVIERGRAMGESSWAAAGMLAAQDPENPAALRELSDLSIALYPEFLRRVETLAGASVPLRSRTALQATRIGESLPRGAAGSGEMLTPARAAALAPGLAASGREFLLLDEASIDPRDLCAALPGAALAAGVGLREATCVLGVEDLADGVLVATTEGRIAAGAFVNCCGAWASQIESTSGIERGASPTLDIAPRKGQMMAVRLRSGQALACVLRTPDIYLVPRRGAETPDDDRVVIGATVEDAGFDLHVYPEAVEWLLKRAGNLWPPIAEAELVETWAGLRPATPDGLPIIGNVSSSEGHSRCWTATGHFRNGILLAPGTARVVAQLLQGLPAGIDLAPFAPQRFTTAVLPVAPTLS